MKGCGINDFGRFAVCGTFIPMGGTSGMLELYKWYTEYAPVPAGAAPKARPVKARAPRADKPAAAASKPWSSVAESSGKPVLKRQPSGRPIKIPNKVRLAFPRQPPLPPPCSLFCVLTPLSSLRTSTALLCPSCRRR